MTDSTSVVHNKWELLDEDTQAEILQYAGIMGLGRLLVSIRMWWGWGCRVVFYGLRKLLIFNRRGLRPHLMMRVGRGRRRYSFKE